MKPLRLFKILSICAGLFFGFTVQSQTLGLTHYNPEVSEGYTLFSTPSQHVYLIDNCGEKINEWTTTTNSQFTAYLFPNGNLLKMGRFNNTSFLGGGASGLLEIYSWEGDLVWSTIYSDENQHLHHNVEILPNGNILLIAWERIGAEEVLAAGRLGVDNDGLWSEKIVEIRPFGTDSYEEVWVWRAWDHIIQDVDSSLSTFGVIADHPNRIDLNLGTLNDGDWLHFNYIDYNETLDQILISSRALSEILIIDHSTTTAEASSNTGGLAGQGGDLLFRWGNQANYNKGDEGDQKLFGQHNGTWIEEGKPGAGNITIFNNGAGIPEGEFYSSIVEISASPINYTYQLEDGIYLPFDVEWTYTADPPQEFYGQRISSCQRQINGNTLINEGTNGRYFEVNAEGALVWQYINPHSQQGILSQGDNPANNATFLIQKYPLDFEGFEDKDVSPKGPIELNPSTSICLSDVETQEILTIDPILQNPSNGCLLAHSPVPFEENFELFSSNGKKLMKGIIRANQKVDLSNYQSGLYFVLINKKMFKLILE